jgi:hypothetical protein
MKHGNKKREAEKKKSLTAKNQVNATNEWDEKEEKKKRRKKEKEKEKEKRKKKKSIDEKSHRKQNTTAYRCRVCVQIVQAAYHHLKNLTVSTRHQNNLQDDDKMENHKIIKMLMKMEEISRKNIIATA